MFAAGELSCTAPPKITTKILTSLIEKVKVTRRLEVEWSLKGKVKRCSSISIPVNKRQIVLNNIAENHKSLNVPHDETYYRSRLCQESLNDPETWGLIADWHFWSRVLCANKIFYLLSLISNWDIFLLFRCYPYMRKNIWTLVILKDMLSVEREAFPNNSVNELCSMLDLSRPSASP